MLVVMAARSSEAKEAGILVCVLVCILVCIPRVRLLGLAGGRSLVVSRFPSLANSRATVCMSNRVFRVQRGIFRRIELGEMQLGEIDCNR